ncbi:uncharacterized protein FRV6_16438 [Fusarium oxysporum]|uniref:Uncharacterized protein n=1 Tax=Fusarium oxysporum TaxID=5507 RepID=A0A2H3U5W9_FUSOX|nr:uncharacterized protein FRV6_16438 [Fusarium oxysporum]
MNSEANNKTNYTTSLKPGHKATTRRGVRQRAGRAESFITKAQYNEDSVLWLSLDIHLAVAFALKIEESVRMENRFRPAQYKFEENLRIKAVL